MEVDEELHGGLHVDGEGLRVLLLVGRERVPQRGALFESLAGHHRKWVPTQATNFDELPQTKRCRVRVRWCVSAKCRYRPSRSWFL